jgi:ADP-ribose pyrophosphatase
MSFNPEQVGPDKVIAEGRIFEIIHKPMQLSTGIKQFEVARRAPGTRIILIRDSQILLIEEFRSELNRTDLRLPGGKVVDTLTEYREVRADQKPMLEHAHDAVIREAEEEVGLSPINPELVGISHCGATVDWDLYYFLANEFSDTPGGPNREAGEDSIRIKWTETSKFMSHVLSGDFGEDRSVPFVLRALSKLSEPRNRDK